MESVAGFAHHFHRPLDGAFVDFAVLDRDLTEERGELTRKGTLRRRQIEEAFAEGLIAFERDNQK